MEGMRGKMSKGEVVVVRPFFTARIAELPQKGAAASWTGFRLFVRSGCGLCFGGHQRDAGV